MQCGMISSLMAGSVLLLAAGSMQAATFDWTTDADANWGAGANWTEVIGSSGRAFPNDAADVARFNEDITADRAVTLDQDITVNEVRFQNNGQSSWTLDAASGKTLTLDGDDPFLEYFIPDSASDTLSTPVEVAGNGTGQAVMSFERADGGATSVTWNGGIALSRDFKLKVDNFLTFNLNGNITGTGDVTVRHDGNRDVRLNGSSHTFDGRLTIDHGGSGRVAVDSLPNNVPITISAGRLQLNSGAETLSVSSLAGNGTLDNNAAVTPHLTFDVAAGDTEQVDVTVNIGPQFWDFTKTGQGTVQLNNTWDPNQQQSVIANGKVVINHGDVLEEDKGVDVQSGATLEIASGITYAPAGNVVFNNGSTLAGAGTYDRGSNLDAAGVTIAPGSSIGELTLDLAGNTLAADSSSIFEFEMDAGATDTLNLLGDLELGNAQFALSGTPTSEWRTLINANSITGSIGSFDETTYDLRVSGSELQVRTIPEPASFALLVLGGLALLPRRRLG